MGKQYEFDGIVKNDKIIWGAGMALRGDVFRKILEANFPVKCTGRVGSKIVSGDDAEICSWYLLLGFEVYYTNSITIKHQIPIQ